MASSGIPQPKGESQPAAYPGTRWSLVQRLAEPGSRVGSGSRRRAFEELALAYWRPVYRTLRVGHQKTREAAEDLTQEFFLGLLEKRTLEKFEADPLAGKFRSLLRSLLDGFVHTADRAERRQKRGGEHRRVPMDPAEIDVVEARIAGAPGEDPFDREWRATVIDRALTDFAACAHGELWARRHEVFRAYDLAPDATARPTYAELAKRLGVKAHDVKNDLVAARRRFAELVLDRIRDECGNEKTAREEFAAVFGGKVA